MPAAVARYAQTTDDVVRAGGSTFVVQVRYPRSEWVTIARMGDHRAAVRAAAAAYRGAASPDGWTPSQVRLIET
jgi:hypothetical protein